VTSSDLELVLDASASLGECPLWDDREGVLWWVDVPEGRLHRLDPGTGTDAGIDVGQPIGAVGLRAAGGLVLALRDGFATARSATPEASRPPNSAATPLPRATAIAARARA
jgi:sugar lactone lactonase YvrE